MASYVVPQVEIHQLFSEIPIALTQNQVPFIFGPNYLLHRYGAPEEKSGTYIGEYMVPSAESEDTSSSSNDAPPYDYQYPNPLDPSKIDDSYTKLFAENAEVVLFRGGSGLVNPYYDKDGIRVLDKLLLTAAAEVAAYVAPEVSAGRRLRLYSGSNEADVEIVSVLETSTDGSDSSLQDGDVQYVVRIDEELSEEDFPSFNGVLLCEIQNGIEITRENLSDDEKKATNWATYADEETGMYGITVNKSGFMVEINDPDVRAFLVAQGSKPYAAIISADLYLEYRELINSAADSIHTLRGANSVIDALGAVNPDNPLAQAVYNAALNAGGQMVRYMAVPTNDLAGYGKVLDTATLTKEVYFMVPVTRDTAVLDLVQAHVNDMSAPTVKRWRVAFVSADIPDRIKVYGSSGTTSGRDFLAKVVAVDPNRKTADVQFVVKNGDSYIPDPDARFKRDVREKDTFVTNFGNQEWGKFVPQEYMITKVVNSYTVRVSDPNGELSEDDAPQKAEILHPYTNVEKAQAIRDISSNFSDRRVYNVFPSVFVGGGVTQTGEFAAACVAGLVASCLPQQPVTNLELVGIDDIPLTYRTFSYDDLNTIASGGTFIVMQDLPGDQVYIRHQISTAYEDNNLNTSELSITKNLDSISFYFDNLTSPYIGKYNITPELLEVLHNVITSGLTYLENTAWGLYGPQVIAEGTEILLLEQDALLKDHVNCNLKLNLPYPFNHLVLKLFV